MAGPSKKEIVQDLEMLARCNMEVDLIEAELKALEEGLISKEVFDHLMSLKSKVPVAERYTTLLKHVHETLQERLKNYELISVNSDMNTTALATQAVEEGLIEKKVLENVSSLNFHVPLAMTTRYLLLCMQETLQKKLESFKAHLLKVNYMSLFIKYQDMKSQCEKYAEMGFSFESVLMPLFPRQSESKIGSLMNQVEHEKDLLKCSEKTGGKIRLSNMPLFQSEVVTTLGPQHLSKLNEVLVGYSYKWKDIGVALNFQPQDLQIIEATPLLIPGAPKSYLTRVLQDWLQMTLSHTLPPTVENLMKVLSSQTVGLGALSNKLQAIVNKGTHDYALHRQYSSTKVSFDEKGASFFPQYNEIHILEGESTLLEIEVTKAGQEDVAYRWVRGGRTQGVQSILYLNKVDITYDRDRISCEVKARLAKSYAIVNVPITVHVTCPSLDMFTNSLASMYLSRPEVPEDTWPPTGSTKYINLAIIKQQKINYGSEYARLTIRGDIDDVLQDKETIDYAKMYDSLKRECQVMFIEGRPGSGKTTFVRKITHDWASNSSRGIIRILLLVSLRVLNTIHNPSLSDILHLFRDLKVAPEVIEKRDGKGVCFVFDGLDEFSPSDGKDSIVYKIIDRSYLHQSTVIVASRPAALAAIRRKADRIIEVLGFTSNQIQEYFDQYPFSDSTKPAKLKTYLLLHPNIFHMCYLPIHATMVAFLFEITGQIPRTETKIYSLFTCFTLMRSVSKNKKLKRSAGDNILQCLNEEEKCYYKQICQLALEKTLVNKQVLNHEEISFIIQVRGDGASSLGLVTVDRTADLYGFKDIYTFLHLTFQEYLAAYHISTLSDEEQMKLIEEHGHKNHMLVVWKFFCGLADLENKFNTLLHKTQGNTLYHFQCAYESQQEIVCAQLLKAVHYDIKIANKFLSTPDFTAIGYVTDKTNISVNLSFTNCDADIVGIDALLSEMEDTSRQSLEGLHLEANDLTPEFIRKFLANFQSLKSLSLVKQGDSSELPQNHECKDFPVLAKLQTLTLKGFQEKSGIIEMMMLALRQCKNLTELCITHNKIGELGARYLSESLRYCRSLQRIDISENGMSWHEIENVLESMNFLKIKHVREDEIINQGGSITVSHDLLLKQLGLSKNLQLLDIALNSKHRDIFLRSCKEWKHLKELRIKSKPEYTLQTTTTVSKALQAYLHNIEILALSSFVNNFRGAKSLTAGLQKCSFLKVLDLSSNKFEGKGLKHLLSVNLSSLEKLYFDNCSLRDKEVMLLSSHLQGFQSLQKLSLRRNFISSSASEALATKLHNCTKLKLDIEDNKSSTADLAVDQSRCSSLWMCVYLLCAVLLISLLVYYFV